MFQSYTPKAKLRDDGLIELPGQVIRSQDYAHYQQRLRRPTDKYSRFANQYQRTLVNTYKAWHAQVRSELIGRIATGEQFSVPDYIQEQVGGLVSRLTSVGNEALKGAAILGLGRALAHRRDSPRVRRRLASILQANETRLQDIVGPSVSERLIDRLRDLIDPELFPGLFAERPAYFQEGPIIDLEFNLEIAFDTADFRVAQQSGGAVVAMFDLQVEAGIEENEQRELEDQPPIPVKWVLDPLANHCADSAQFGTLGCPGLARVYPGGWAELPTFPAGNVTCRGNDRCHLEADFGSGFQRV